MPQGRLAQVLRGLHRPADERLLVGPDTLDDAGVVLLGSGEGLSAQNAIALVQTVDFFPPVVDDPWYYGAIAAANSLSDVYAMGGRPLSALTLACFPKDFEEEWIGTILRGGFDKIVEAGAVVAGGHTVEGAVQFGFSVTGTVHRDRVAANAGARPGDVAYLTKSIGMGTLTTAAKKKAIGWETLEPAARQMATLNAAAAEAMAAAMPDGKPHACTDITGFGLVGHAHNVARASGATLRIETGAVPLFEGALELARRGHLSGGAKRGRANLGPTVSIGAGIDDALVNLLFDAETSGGLLIVVPAERAADLERELAARSLPICRVGTFVASGEHVIELM